MVWWSLPQPGHVRSTKPPFATKSAMKVSRSVEAASQVEQDSRLQLSVVVASPAQSAPPVARPLHVRVEVVVPSPQVAEQMLVVQPDQAPSTGHAWVLQFCDVLVEPARSAPPVARPLHVRVIVWVPVPQLLEQAAYVSPDQVPLNDG
jgi:hypothetical protein